MLKWEWLDSQLMREWERSTSAKFIGMFLVYFLFLFVSAGLDTLTPLPTPVWAGIWVVMPLILGYLFPKAPKLYYLHGYNDSQKSVAKWYYSLSKSEKSLLPHNFIEAIKEVGSTSLLRDLEKTARNVVYLHNQKENFFRPPPPPSKANIALEQLNEIQKELNSDLETYKKLG